MKKLTDEIRLAIFQQNIGSDIQITDLSDNEYSTLIGIDQYHENHILTPSFPEPVGSCVLLKRPLSSITDEEAKAILSIINSDHIFVKVVRDKSKVEIECKIANESFRWIHLFNGGDIIMRENSGAEYLKIYQYLHSRGFTLPYLDWSVEELVSNNVYKLIEE